MIGISREWLIRLSTGTKGEVNEGLRIIEIDMKMIVTTISDHLIATKMIITKILNTTTILRKTQFLVERIKKITNTKTLLRVRMNNTNKN